MAALSVALLALTAFATAKMNYGLDYFFDGGAAIDALVRRDLDAFFENQPLMGPLSLLIRAPFVALVFYGSETTVFLIGVLPLLGALLALGVVLARAMEKAGRAPLECVAVLVVCTMSPLVVRAIHWGHPEELLAAALAVAGVLAASRGRCVVAGVFVGAAVATKQWAVLAALPALLTLPAGQWRFLAAASFVSLVMFAPMAIGDPDRFRAVVEAASSSDPEAILGVSNGGEQLPGSRVTPTNVWWPLSSGHDVSGGVVYWQPEWLGRATHTLILVVCAGLAALVGRRRGRLTGVDAMRLAALIFLLRAALDPMSLDYYHVPLLVSLGAVAALGTQKDAIAALAVAVGLSLAFIHPAQGVLDVAQLALLKWIAYSAVVLPTGFWLVRSLMRARRPGPSAALGRPRQRALAADPLL